MTVGLDIPVCYARNSQCSLEPLASNRDEEQATEVWWAPFSQTHCKWAYTEWMLTSAGTNSALVPWFRSSCREPWVGLDGAPSQGLSPFGVKEMWQFQPVSKPIFSAKTYRDNTQQSHKLVHTHFWCAVHTTCDMLYRFLKQHKHCVFQQILFVYFLAWLSSSVQTHCQPR